MSEKHILSRQKTKWDDLKYSDGPRPIGLYKPPTHVSVPVGRLEELISLAKKTKGEAELIEKIIQAGQNMRRVKESGRITLEAGWPEATFALLIEVVEELVKLRGGKPTPSPSQPSQTKEME